MNSPVIVVAPLDLQLARLEQEVHMSNLTWMPALRSFWPGTRSNWHGDFAVCFEFQTRISVDDVETEGGAAWGFRRSDEDFEVGNEPWRLLNKSVACLTVL